MCEYGIVTERVCGRIIQIDRDLVVELVGRDKVVFGIVLLAEHFHIEAIGNFGRQWLFYPEIAVIIQQADILAPGTIFIFEFRPCNRLTGSGADFNLLRIACLEEEFLAAIRKIMFEIACSVLRGGTAKDDLGWIERKQ